MGDAMREMMGQGPTVIASKRKADEQPVSCTKFPWALNFEAKRRPLTLSNCNTCTKFPWALNFKAKMHPLTLSNCNKQVPVLSFPGL